MSLTVRKGAYIPGVVQNIAIGATSVATSNAVGTGTTIVRVSVNADAYLAIGASPTATSANMLLPAGATEFLAVTGGVTKFAVIQVGSSAGFASITELA
jgi:hypothetical protein